MRIDNQDIARMARQLRDEDNQQLHVRPWSRRSHFRFPAWLAAIPAAVLAGFVLGLWTGSKTGQQEGEEPLMAYVDTVYVTVQETLSTTDTAQAQPSPEPQSAPAPKHARKSRPAGHDTIVTTGLPIVHDRIRYDLLVRN